MILNYDLILRATAGETTAIYTVLEYYNSRIDSLCSCPYIRSDGKTVCAVDEQMKLQLQGKLIRAIFKFNPDKKP